MAFSKWFMAWPYLIASRDVMGNFKPQLQNDGTLLARQRDKKEGQTLPCGSVIPGVRMNQGDRKIGRGKENGRRVFRERGTSTKYSVQSTQYALASTERLLLTAVY